MINFLNLLMREMRGGKGSEQKPPTAQEFQQWLDQGGRGPLGWFSEAEMRLFSKYSPEEFENISVDLIAESIKEVYAHVVNEVEESKANPTRKFRVVGFPDSSNKTRD